LAVGMAELIPNLGLFISLVGAVSSSTLAFIFPPIINIFTRWNCPDHLNWVFWKDISVLTFGLIGFATGTYASLENIMKPDE